MAREFIPIRIPGVHSGSTEYKHIPLIELYALRSIGDRRAFYAYELGGKGISCLRLSIAPANGKLTMLCDRVMELPDGLNEEIDLPGNMIALLQTHLALAIALRHNPEAVARLKERLAGCSAWFMRHKSAIDMDTFLDPAQSYNRFGVAAW